MNAWRISSVILAVSSFILLVPGTLGVWYYLIFTQYASDQVDWVSLTFLNLLLGVATGLLAWKFWAKQRLVKNQRIYDSLPPRHGD